MIKRLFAISVFLLSSSALATVPGYWQTSSYAINTQQTSVQEVLEDFAESFGVRLVVSEPLSGYSTGWKRSENAVDFLDRFAHEHRLQWFVYGKKLYVSPDSDIQVKHLEQTSQFKDALIGVGLFQEKFGWGELPDEETVLVSGPRAYVKLVSGISRKKKQEEQNAEIFFYPLKYASVSDRVVKIRSQKVTIPGVATILQNLLQGKQTPVPGTIVNETFHGNGRLEANPSIAARQQFEQRRNKKKSDESVEADLRTNSVIIKSAKKGYGYYKSIIDKLDKSQKLIEIDAVIVDINREKLTEFGTDISFLDHRGRGNASSSGLASAGNIAATIFINDLGRFHAQLKALEGTGEASIIANTTILTMENQPSVIDLSETAYIQTVGERVANLESVTAGTLLNVMPSTVDEFGETFIKLDIEIEDGQIIERDSQNTPKVRKTMISTAAVIDESRSLVVGGYNVVSKEKNRRKVPVLGSVPVVGSLFSSKTSKQTQQERLFILTPKVSPTSHNPADYSITGHGNEIARTLKRIEKRWENANRSYVEKTRELFSILATQGVPGGYELAKTSKKEKLPFYCRQEDFSFHFSKKQKISGRGVVAYAGVVVNESAFTQHVIESSCAGRGMIGVTVFPQKQIAPGEQAEVFVALEASMINQVKRPVQTHKVKNNIFGKRDKAKKSSSKKAKTQRPSPEESVKALYQSVQR